MACAILNNIPCALPVQNCRVDRSDQYGFLAKLDLHVTARHAIGIHCSLPLTLTGRFESKRLLGDELFLSSR